MKIEYKPIGIIRTPHKTLEGMPIQPAGARGVQGQVLVDEEYAEGLADLEGFSHIYILYHFHLVTQMQLKVVPFLDNESRGLFSTRAPKRPNPLGLSIVRLLSVEDNQLNVTDIDVLDNTPLLDVKPYAPEFDIHEVSSIGWMEKNQGKVHSKRSDERFK